MPNAMMDEAAGDVVLSAVITRLAQVAGVDCAVLVDRERFAIEAEGDAGTDADALATVAPRLAGMAAGIARDLGRGECSGAMVTRRDGAFLVRDVARAAVIAMSFRDSEGPRWRTRPWRAPSPAWSTPSGATEAA